MKKKLATGMSSKTKYIIILSINELLLLDQKPIHLHVSWPSVSHMILATKNRRLSFLKDPFS